MQAQQGSDSWAMCAGHEHTMQAGGAKHSSARKGQMPWLGSQV